MTDASAKGPDDDDDESQSFIALAAFCSTWLPCVVGDHKKIFLVSGVTSLATKVLLLAVALTFAETGLQSHVYKRPFLLFCFKENPIHLSETGVTQCKMSNGTCIQSRSYRKKLEKHESWEKGFLDALVELERKWPERDEPLLKKVNNASTLFSQIKHLKGEVEEDLESSIVGKVQQKIRICEEDEIENWFRLYVLSSLFVIVTLAALATYKLHRIADYKVYCIGTSY